MSNQTEEITALEERLRLAELGPDPAFFEEILADDVVLVTQDAGVTFTKQQVVSAHQPGNGPKFTRVTMSDLRIAEYGHAAVVTCSGLYESDAQTVTLRFMRVWLQREGRWQVIAASVVPQ